MSKKIAKHIGNYIGRFVESDPNDFMGVWRNYMRIHVAIDVRFPLKCKMKIRKQGGEWVWLSFKYERLPPFCFVCGRLGHTEKFCEADFANHGSAVERKYGTWLRAPLRRSQQAIGERWLRDSHPAREDGIDR